MLGGYIVGACAHSHTCSIMQAQKYPATLVSGGAVVYYSVTVTVPVAVADTSSLPVTLTVTL